MRASLTAVARLALEADGRAFDPADVVYDRLDWAALDWRSGTSLRALMVRRWAPATVNRHLAAVRGVLRCAHLSGLLDSEQAERARLALKSVPTDRGGSPVGRWVSDQEMETLLSALVHGRLIDARDAAMVAVLAMGGLRRSEAVALDLSDYRPATGELMVRHGKGGRARKVWLHGGGAAAMDAWLVRRGGWEGPILVPVTRGGELVQSRISPHAIWKRLRRLARVSGVDGFTPHDLRRKVVSDLLDAGVDMSAVQQLAGHASISTTARYDRRGEHAARRASMRLTLPYRAPGPPPTGESR